MRESAPGETDGTPAIEPERLSAAELITLLGRPDPVIVEVGANDGSTTRWFLKHFGEAQVFCFEPDPRAARRFTERTRDDRAQLLVTAVSGGDGTIRFHMSSGHPPGRDPQQFPEGWDLSGSIRRPREHVDVHPWCTFDDVIEVPSIRLDTWFASSGLEQVDFIWADVQGAEADLIEGAALTLEKTRYLYTEYSERELYEGQLGLAALLEMLPRFEIVHRYREDVLLRNRRLAAGGSES